MELTLENVDLQNPLGGHSLNDALVLLLQAFPDVHQGKFVPDLTCRTTGLNMTLQGSRCFSCNNYFGFGVESGSTGNPLGTVTTKNYSTGTPGPLGELSVEIVATWLGKNSGVANISSLWNAPNWFLRLGDGALDEKQPQLGHTATYTVGKQITPYVPFSLLVSYHNGDGVWTYQDGKLETTTTYDENFNFTSVGLLKDDSGGRPGATLVHRFAIYNRRIKNNEAAFLYDEFIRGYPSLLNRYPRRFWPVTTGGIAFDAASNSGYQTALASYSWSHTCTGTDRFLAVDVSVLGLATGTTVTGITYNGVALSLIKRETSVGIDGVECWGLANPASGTNTIAVTLSGASADSVGTAASYANVHQSSPTEGAAGNNSLAPPGTATVDVTTVADNDWVHAAVASDDASITAGQTERNNITGAGGSGLNEDTGPKTPPGVQTMTATGVANLKTWVIAAYAIRPNTASSLTTTSIYLPLLGVG